MYPPKHHQETNFENIVATIKKYPLATLISINKNEPIITHAPLLFKDEGKLGKLIGHIDIHNPQVELFDNKPITLIFHGPECYISPTIYSTQQLPTWNYIKIHIQGHIKRIDEPKLVMESLVAMNSFLETSEEPFLLNMEHQKMNRLVNYIVGFEIDIISWEGKFKLSQDKILKDITLAKNALLNSQAAHEKQYIESVYENHKTEKF